MALAVLVPLGLGSYPVYIMQPRQGRDPGFFVRSFVYFVLLVCLIKKVIDI